MFYGTRSIGRHPTSESDLKIGPGIRHAPDKENAMQRYPVRKKWMLRPVARCSGGC